MHVDGPGATQKFERKAMVVEERWLKKTESRKKSHSGKSGWEPGGKISDEPCDAFDSPKRKTRCPKVLMTPKRVDTPAIPPPIGGTSPMVKKAVVERPRADHSKGQIDALCVWVWKVPST